MVYYLMASNTHHTHFTTPDTCSMLIFRYKFRYIQIWYVILYQLYILFRYIYYTKFRYIQIYLDILYYTSCNTHIIRPQVWATSASWSRSGWFSRPPNWLGLLASSAELRRVCVDVFLDIDMRMFIIITAYDHRHNVQRYIYMYIQFHTMYLQISMIYVYCIYIYIHTYITLH